MMVHTVNVGNLTMEWKIEQLSHSRFSELVQLLVQVFSQLDPVLIRRNVELANLAYCASEGDGCLVAGCWVRDLVFDTYKVGGIGGVAVRKDRRGHGLGQHLMKIVLRDLSAQYDAFLLWTEVRDFFFSVGFHDFSYGIEMQEGDNLPMLYPIHDDLRIGIPSTPWSRIRF
jgi:N-acetylglutamate synthase-like GNAT family acetyltransferase